MLVWSADKTMVRRRLQGGLAAVVLAEGWLVTRHRQVLLHRVSQAWMGTQIREAASQGRKICKSRWRLSCETPSDKLTCTILFR